MRYNKITQLPYSCSPYWKEPSYVLYENVRDSVRNMGNGSNIDELIKVANDLKPFSKVARKLHPHHSDTFDYDASDSDAIIKALNSEIGFLDTIFKNDPHSLLKILNPGSPIISSNVHTPSFLKRDTKGSKSWNLATPVADVDAIPHKEQFARDIMSSRAYVSKAFGVVARAGSKIMSLYTHDKDTPVKIGIAQDGIEGPKLELSVMGETVSDPLPFVLAQGTLGETDGLVQGRVHADLESISKFTIMRVSKPLWYLKSYVPSNNDITSTDAKALDLMDKYLFSSATKQAVAALAARGFGDASSEENASFDDMVASPDPWGTNSGWPLFAPQINGVDAKHIIKSMASSIASKPGFRPPMQSKESVVSFLSALAGLSEEMMPGISSDPFPMTAITRRMKITSSYTAYATNPGDESIDSVAVGIPDQRVAFMYPYICNVLLHRIAAVMKFYKHAVIGSATDVDSKRKTNKFINGINLFSGKEGWFVFENDASGFDTMLSFNHNRVMFERLSVHIARLTGYSIEAILTLLMQTRSMPILIPDPRSHKEEAAGLVLGGQHGLLSGSKITNEVGTLATIWMTVSTWIKLGIPESQIAGYLQGKSYPSRVIVGASGDDNTHFVKGASLMTEYIPAIRETYADFGLGADIVPGDRLLMRHISLGADAPVLGRIIQQRLGNEKISATPDINALGWLASLENVMPSCLLKGNVEYRISSGSKPMDPVNLSKSTEAVKYVNAKAAVLSELISAAFPYPQQSHILLKCVTARSSNYASQYQSMYDKFSESVTKALREQLRTEGDKILTAMKEGKPITSKEINGLITLWKDRYSPSTSAILQTIMTNNPHIRGIIEQMAVYARAHTDEMLSILKL